MHTPEHRIASTIPFFSPISGSCFQGSEAFRYDNAVGELESQQESCAFAPRSKGNGIIRMYLEAWDQDESQEKAINLTWVKGKVDVMPVTVHRGGRLCVRAGCNDREAKDKL